MPVLIEAIAPARSRAADLLLILSATALTALAAQVTVLLPWTPVPFTLQPLAVLLTAAALGSRRAALAQALYLLAGASGAPVFTPSPLLPPGPARFLGPTGGYLLAYVPAAFLVGWLAERGWDRSALTAPVAMTAGLGAIYLGGVSWLVLLTGASFLDAVLLGVLPFLSGDILKIALGTALLPAIRRSIG